MSKPKIAPHECHLSESELRIEKAYAEWSSRQDRHSHPPGNFDDRSRWYPVADERCTCCDAIRSPSAAYPFSLMTHCRSAEHVASLHDVPASGLRSRIAQDRRKRQGGDEYFKAVAVQGNRFLSIFDGETEYRVGETVSDRALQGHGGGIYVYASEQEARRAQVPRASALRDAPHVVLRVRAEGAYCRYDNGKLAFSRVTPLEICC